MKLKTLNDLVRPIPEGLTCACGNCDLRNVKYCEIKKEVIKWVKNIKERQNDLIKPADNFKEIFEYLQGQIDVLIDFHNITEEDLK